LAANTFRLSTQSDFLKLAAREWPLLLNGEVCFTFDRSRSNGCFRGIIEFR